MEIIRLFYQTIAIILFFIFMIFMSLTSPLGEDKASITKDLDGDGKNETIFTEQATDKIYLHIHEGGFVFKDKWKSKILCYSWEKSCITRTLRIYDYDNDGVEEITIITEAGFPQDDFFIYIFNSKTRELEKEIETSWDARPKLFDYVKEGRKLNITIDEAMERAWVPDFP